MNIDNTRRLLLKGIMAAAALAAAPVWALTRNKAAFEATAPDAALKALFADKPISESAEVSLKVPDIAENGAVVPVTIATTLAGAKSISIVVEANPNPLSASFTLLEGANPEISTRIKMGESSDVVAAVETDAGIFTARKNVKVTIGGCGG
jgi:sulfur-oxidizing protein SoxY